MELSVVEELTPHGQLGAELGQGLFELGALWGALGVERLYGTLVDVSIISLFPKLTLGSLRASGSLKGMVVLVRAWMESPGTERRPVGRAERILMSVAVDIVTKAQCEV